MIPAFRKIQAGGRPLLVRGPSRRTSCVSSRVRSTRAGLYLYLMVGSSAEAEALRPALDVVLQT